MLEPSTSEELQTCVRDIRSVAQHRYAHRLHACRLTPEEMQCEIQIVDHQIQDDVDLRPTRPERGETMSLHESMT